MSNNQQQPQEYRIVKEYSGFFCHWFYSLEKLHRGKWFGLFPYSYWDRVAGNSLTTDLPKEWLEQFNIVDQIERKP